MKIVMPRVRMISHHLRPYVQRAVIALSEKQSPFERIDIDLGNKPSWFGALSPLGRTRLLMVDETPVFESQVIVEYLDEITPGSLHPSAPLERARHRSWIQFGSETLAAIAGMYSAPDAERVVEKRAALAEKLVRVEREMVGPFVDGPEFQLIDGVWGTVFRWFDAFDQIPGVGGLAEFGRLGAWRAAVEARPSVAAAAPADYRDRPLRFLAARKAHISTLVSPADAAA